MTIRLYINNSEDERVYKQLTLLTTYSGVIFKGETSIMEPALLLTGDIAAITGANYLYIVELGRYYFISDIISVRSGLVEIRAKIDTITTYSGQLINQTALISRQQNAWNLYVDDGSFRVQNRPMVLTKKFSGGFSNTYDFVLTVAGS